MSLQNPPKLMIIDCSRVITVVQQSLIFLSSDQIHNHKQVLGITAWCMAEALERSLLMTVNNHCKQDELKLKVYSQIKHVVEADVYNNVFLDVIQVLRLNPVNIKITGRSLFIW